MAHKGTVTVATSVLSNLAAAKGAQVSKTSGYLVITKPGAPDKQVLVENFQKKGATESITRWVECRGKGKTPFVPSSPGIVPHSHSSPSITHRLDTDSSPEKVIEQFGLLIDFLMGVEVKKEEKKEEIAGLPAGDEPLSAPAEEKAEEAPAQEQVAA